MKKFILLLLILLGTSAYSHSGRTDSTGGHHTSRCDHSRGICYYHYH